MSSKEAFTMKEAPLSGNRPKPRIVRASGNGVSEGDVLGTSDIAVNTIQSESIGYTKGRDWAESS